MHSCRGDVSTTKGRARHKTKIVFFHFSCFHHNLESLNDTVLVLRTKKKQSSTKRARCKGTMRFVYNVDTNSIFTAHEATYPLVYLQSMQAYQVSTCCVYNICTRKLDIESNMRYKNNCTNKIWCSKCSTSIKPRSCCALSESVSTVNLPRVRATTTPDAGGRPFQSPRITTTEEENKTKNASKGTKRHFPPVCCPNIYPHNRCIPCIVTKR